MSDTLQPSPMIAASELLRANLDALQLDDLIEHEQEARKVLAGLNDYTNQPTHRSADERRNLARLAEKMRLHMAHLRDLIYARTAALALVHAAQSEGADDAMQGSRAFRH